MLKSAAPQTPEPIPEIETGIVFYPLKTVTCEQKMWMNLPETPLLYEISCPN